MKKILLCIAALCIVGIPLILTKTNFVKNMMNSGQSSSFDAKIDHELVRYSITPLGCGLYLSKDVKFIKKYYNGEEWNFGYCEYNRQGFITKKEYSEGEAGGDVTTYTYNSENQLIKQYREEAPPLCTQTTEFMYDNNGLLVKTQTISKDEDNDIAETTTETTLFYDSQNNPVKAAKKVKYPDYESFDNDGIVSYNYSYDNEYFIYATNGNLMQRYVLSDDGKDTTDAVTFQYDENNNVIKEKGYGDGYYESLIHEYHPYDCDNTYTYDPYNNCIKEIHYKEDYDYVVTREFKTDSFGRIIKIIETEQDGDDETRTNIIYVEYYD